MTTTPESSDHTGGGAPEGHRDRPSGPVAPEPVIEAAFEAVLDAELQQEAVLETQVESEREGRRATNLELFLDLVFVFAVTQIATMIGGDLTWAGVGRGLLVAFLVWWLWSQFTWLGTAIDLGQRSPAQFLVLAAVPPTLLMAVALPQAYGPDATKFAAAYLVVQWWALAIQGRGLWADPKTRAAFLRYMPLAALAPIVLVIGSRYEGGVRIALWTAVAVFNIVAAQLSGGGRSDSGSQWNIDAAHFAERHSLFVIISLGEVLVAAGATASGEELTPLVGAGLVAAVTVACVLWWTYFAFVPARAEWAVAHAHGRERARLARNLYSFGHFPIVFGVVLYAVVAKHLVADPTGQLPTPDLVVLAASVTSFVGGLLWLQWNVVHRMASERIVAVGVAIAWCALVGPWLQGVAVVAGMGAIVALMQGITMYRSRTWAPLAAPPE